MLETFAFALVIVCAIMALGGTGLAVGGALVRDRQLARRGLRRRDPTPVGAVTDEADVKLVGVAVRSDGCELVAPISGRHCIAYEITIAEIDGVRPTLLAREAEAQPFLLRDSTGVAHVVPGPARIGITLDKQWRLEPKRHHKRLETLMMRHPPEDRWRGHTLIVCEGVIQAGDDVAVFGHATREPDPDAIDNTYRSVAWRPLLTGTPLLPLLLCDAD